MQPDSPHAPSTPRPKATAQVAPYVEALGPDLAVRFLLEFGGAELSIADSPKARSAFAAFVGPEAAARLAALKDRLPRRVPLAKPWLARSLHWAGHSKAQIARTLRVSDISVRKWLNDSKDP